MLATLKLNVAEMSSVRLCPDAVGHCCGWKPECFVVPQSLFAFMCNNSTDASSGTNQVWFVCHLISLTVCLSKMGDNHKKKVKIKLNRPVLNQDLDIVIVEALLFQTL